MLYALSPEPRTQNPEPKRVVSYKEEYVMNESANRPSDHRSLTAVAGKTLFLSISGAAASWVLLLCIFVLFPYQAMGETGQDVETKGAQAKKTSGTQLGVNPEELIRSMDANGDGKIAREEANAETKPYFDSVDANSDGFIDIGELKQILGQSRKRPRTSVDDAEWPPVVKPATAPVSYSPDAAGE